MLTPLEKFQEKIGTKIDNDFGPKTIKAGAKFLKLTNTQAAHFFAQCSHETRLFKVFEENLNYSYGRLLVIFKNDFDVNNNRFIDEHEKPKARRLARKPREIANFVYANQNGNGNEASGDGWKYRGFGAIQTTGRRNVTLLSRFLKDPEIIERPELIKDKYAFESAFFYFDSNNLWRFCDRVDNSRVRTVTKRVNGGTNGLSHRRQLTYQYYSWLNR